jgi:hypothetical protein
VAAPPDAANMVPRAAVPAKRGGGYLPMRGRPRAARAAGRAGAGAVANGAAGGQALLEQTCRRRGGLCAVRRKAGEKRSVAGQNNVASRGTSLRKGAGLLRPGLAAGGRNGAGKAAAAGGGPNAPAACGWQGRGPRGGAASGRGWRGSHQEASAKRVAAAVGGRRRPRAGAHRRPPAVGACAALGGPRAAAAVWGEAVAGASSGRGTNRALRGSRARGWVERTEQTWASAPSANKGRSGSRQCDARRPRAPGAGVDGRAAAAAGCTLGSRRARSGRGGEPPGGGAGPDAGPAAAARRRAPRAARRRRRRRGVTATPRPRGRRRRAGASL